MHPQPFDIYPDLADEDLRGAWLNRTIAHKALGKDAQAGKYDLTPVNPTDMIARPVGCEFGGTNGYLRGAGGIYSNWRSADEAGTIMAWINISSLAAHCGIFADADEVGSVDRFLIYVHTTGRIVMETRLSETWNIIWTPVGTLVVNQWYHVAVVSDGSEWFIYVNGVLQGGLTLQTGVNNGTWLGDIPLRDNVTIGAVTSGGVPQRYFAGEIRDVRYYSRVLT